MANQDQLIQDLKGAYGEIRSAVEGLDDQQASQPFLDDRWAAKDIVAHLVGWNSTFPGFLRRIAEGQRPVPEGADYSNVDEWNSKFAKQGQGRTLDQLLQDLNATEPEFEQAIRLLPDDRLDDGKTAHRLIKTVTADHMREHAEHVREWRRRTGV